MKKLLVLSVGLAVIQLHYSNLRRILLCQESRSKVAKQANYPSACYPPCPKFLSPKSKRASERKDEIPPKAFSLYEGVVK